MGFWPPGLFSTSCWTASWLMSSFFIGILQPPFLPCVYLGVVRLKGNSHQKVSVANMIELFLKSFLVYHSPMFEAWKVEGSQKAC